MPSLREDDAVPLPYGVVPSVSQGRHRRLRHRVSAAESLVNRLLEDEGEPEPEVTPQGSNRGEQLLNALKDTSASKLVIQTHYGDHVLEVWEWWEARDEPGGTFHVSVRAQPE